MLFFEVSAKWMRNFHKFQHFLFGNYLNFGHNVVITMHDVSNLSDDSSMNEFLLNGINV